MAGQTHGSTIPVTQLTPADRDAMYELMCCYYLGVTRQDFERDLSHKHDVILLRTEDTIVGFSTLARLPLEVSGRQVHAIFSGDTIVDALHRGSLEMAHQICGYFLRAIEASPGQEFYWVLISKGWRTYRVLRFLFRDFAPRYDAGDPQTFAEIAYAFGARYYPEHYNPTTHLIEFVSESQRIRPGSAEAIDHRRADADMRFFERANPNHERGVELVCVAPFTYANLTPAARQLAGKHHRAEPKS